MSKVVIWPVGKEVEAQAYHDAANTHYAANYEEGGQFTYIRNDAFGQWVCGYYGEILNGVPFEEPQGFAELRADGVVHTSVVWPTEEEVEAEG